MSMNPSTHVRQLNINAARLSDTTRATLAFVDKFGPVSFEVLFAKFCSERSGSRAREQYRANLNYLVDAGYLSTDGRSSERTWQIDCSPRVVKPVAVPAYVASRDRLTPPAQYDRMHAPAYVPEAGPALRPGALDFKRCASVGHRC